MPKTIARDTYHKYKELTDFENLIANALKLENAIKAKLNEGASAAKSGNFIILSSLNDMIDIQDGVLLNMENGTMMITNSHSIFNEQTFMMKLDKSRSSIGKVVKINLKSAMDVKKAAIAMKSNNFTEAYNVLNSIISSRKDVEQFIEGFKQGLQSLGKIAQ